MLGRVDDDSHMPTPNNQVTGLWLSDSDKTSDSNIKVNGSGIRIRIAGAAIHFVSQMRTIRRLARLLIALPRGLDNVFAFSRRQ